MFISRLYLSRLLLSRLLLSRLPRFFKLLDFYGKRNRFYLDYERSIGQTELLRDFLAGELAISTAPGTRDASRALALAEMRQRLAAGEENRVSRIIGLSMPDDDLFMLSALDEVGEREQVRILRQIAESIELKAAAKKSILTALSAPLILLPSASFYAYVLSAKMIPVIEKSAPPEVWGPFNSLVRDVAHLIHHQGALLLLLGVLGGAWLWYGLSRWTSPLRFWIESLPPSLALALTPVLPFIFPLVLYRDFQALQLLSTLAVFLKTGKTVKAALRAMAVPASPYLRTHIRRIIDRFERNPTDMASAFHGGILSHYILARMSTYARTTNRYEEVLTAIGTDGAQEIHEQVKKHAKKLNFLFLGTVVALFLFLMVGQSSIVNDLNKQNDPATIKLNKMRKEQAKHT